MSLVELMVGVAVGLFVVAGATTLAASQLSANRRLLLETQVQQDLRAAAEIITRDLRRGGYDSTSQRLVWSAQPATNPLRNIWGGISVDQGDDVVSYAYDRPSAGTQSFGYQLGTGANSGTIRQRIGTSVQDLTDRNTLKITHFSVTFNTDAAGNSNVPEVKLACPRLCPTSPPSQSCWPSLRLIDAVIKITGEAASDPAVSRTVVSRVRLRNDAVTFNNGSTQVCP